jgi:two-component system OmpR family sensor kinase
LWPALVIASVGLVALAVFVERSLHASMISSVDDELVRVGRVGGVRPPGQNAPPPDSNDAGARPPAPGSNIPAQMLVSTNGNVLELLSGANPFSAEQRTKLAAKTGTVTVDGAPLYRVRTERRQGDMLITAIDISSVEDAIAEVRKSFLIGGLVIFALEGLLIASIAASVTRPLTRINRAADRIADGQLDTELGPPSGTRETIALTQDLSRMVARIRGTITEREAAVADAVDARNDMARFIADASHELRTPLAALIGYSQLYSSGMLETPAEVDRAMGRIGSESQRLSQLVNNLLLVARGETPTEAVDEVDLDELTGAVVADANAAFPRHTITHAASHARGAVVRCNGPAIHQAVLNLVANACQHNAEGTAVTVEVRCAEGAVVVAVSDNGQGIAPDLAEKIFLPLFQADASRSRTAQRGAGLGLALTRRLVEREGGTVELAAAATPGATFLLRLPRPAPE